MDIKKFCLRFVLILAVICFIDFSFGYILRKNYYKQKSGLQYRTTFAIESTKADLLIFGSSKALRHYKPEVFEDSLKVSVYNCGKDGQSIIYHYAIFNSILKRYIPKYIVLDVILTEFSYNQAFYDRLAELLPYSKTHKEIIPIIQLKSRYEKIKLLSQIYPFNSGIFTMVAGTNNIKNKSNTDYKGFVPLFDVMRKADPKMLIRKYTELIPDKTKEHYFNLFVQTALRNNIKIFVLVSPYYNKYFNDNTISKLKELSAKNNVNFIDYSSSDDFDGKYELFFDPEHLNIKGAELYSKIIAHKILNYNKVKGE